MKSIFFILPNYHLKCMPKWIWGDWGGSQISDFPLVSYHASLFSLVSMPPVL